MSHYEGGNLGTSSGRSKTSVGRWGGLGLGRGQVSVGAGPFAEVDEGGREEEEEDGKTAAGGGDMSGGVCRRGSRARAVA